MCQLLLLIKGPKEDIHDKQVLSSCCLKATIFFIIATSLPIASVFNAIAIVMLPQGDKLIQLNNIPGFYLFY